MHHVYGPYFHSAPVDSAPVPFTHKQIKPRLDHVLLLLLIWFENQSCVNVRCYKTDIIINASKTSNVTLGNGHTYCLLCTHTNSRLY